MGLGVSLSTFLNPLIGALVAPLSVRGSHTLSFTFLKISSTLIASVLHLVERERGLLAFIWAEER